MSSNAITNKDLWMGGITKPYMNEIFILAAFMKMGQKPLSVKFNKKKRSGEPPGFCHIRFATEGEVKKALIEMNGKLIPNSVPPARFHLSTSGVGKIAIPKYSLWLTDLSLDVDDSTLLKAFTQRFRSVVSAKIIVDMTGFSKGIGHVQFTNEDDHKNCLKTMNGFRGLGSKPLKISSSLPLALSQASSSSGSSGNKGASQGSSHHVERSYWQNYAAWQNSDRDSTHSNYAAELTTLNIIDTVVERGDDLELIEHNTKVDVDSWNKEMIQRDYNLWDALECSKWLPLNMNERSVLDDYE
ncbi:hypothetical protein LSTR_LSTR007065 [Laodelphax striatellus]|uniref:tRNA selenocysteine-associated protein 1 n=1 Tax=Laodelphax striatellus TaxID=195883 RepID=A0A482WJI3_LAOST|nr:hypothetical protein LSTR_LSTR007065 [Laodelphax striatellus]